jgi:hypothetical protein
MSVAAIMGTQPRVSGRRAVKNGPFRKWNSSDLTYYELSCYTQLDQSHFFCSFFLEDAPGIRCS